MDNKRWDREGPLIGSTIDVPNPNTFISSDRRSDMPERDLSER